MSNSTGATIATCVTKGDWSFNSLGQSPCDIASALGGVCIGGQFTLSALPPGFVYLGPSVANANACRCSTVYYSLLSACAICQGRDYIKWSAYDGNCTTVSVSIFPEPIPAGTLVPHYAYLDVTTTDAFNISFAQSAGGAESSPVSTVATYSPTQTGTKAMSSSKVPVGPIVGGVIGGLILIALLAGFIFWLIRSNRNKTPPSSQLYYGPDTPSSPPPMSFSGTGAPPKLYDPTDPSTYPTSYTPPVAYTPSYGNVTPNYTGASHNTVVGYPGRFTGAPEVT